MSVNRSFTLYDYEEKIIIMSQVNKSARNVTKIARKYNIGESTIRRWFIEAKYGNLKKDGKIILKDMQRINIQTTEMKMISRMNECITKEDKIIGLLPFLLEVGFSLEDGLELLKVKINEYNKFKKRVI